MYKQSFFTLLIQNHKSMLKINGKIKFFYLYFSFPIQIRIIFKYN